MSDLKQTCLGLPGVGERAALESEDLGLEQGLGNGCAVDVDEGRARTRASLVDEMGNQSLAGSGLSLD